MKRMIFLGFALIMAVSVFAGGGRQTNTQSAGTPGVYRADPNLNAPGVFPICKETVTLKVGIGQYTTIQDWATNYMTKQLEAKGNFKLEFEVFPGAEFAQQLNLMVAAGGNDLPDIIMCVAGDLTDSTVFQYGLAGAIIPLNDYLKNSAYFINDAKARTGVDFMAMVTSPDGNVYALPEFNQSLQNEYPSKLWIYQPWLDRLGLKAPETPNELYTVLKAFKERDPNGNGLADEIPLIDHRDNWNSGVIKALISPFQYVSSRDWFTVENGRVGVAYNTNGFREAMRFIRSLVAEDLLSPLSFTQDRAQMTAIISGQPTVVGMHVYMAMDMLSGTDQRRAEYKGIAPLKSADGTIRTPWAPSVASPKMAISKNSKTPEAAFRLGDLMISEEFSIMTRWGEYGVDWVGPAPGDVSIFASLGYPPTVRAIAPWGVPQNKWWAQVGPYVRSPDFSLGQIFDGNMLNTGYHVAQIQAAYTGKHPSEHVTKLIYTSDEDRRISEILLNLDSYVKESIARFAVGDLSVDRDWDSYLSGLRGLGLDTMLPVVQQVYARTPR